MGSIGRAQAERLASELASKSFDLVQSSPRLRAQQTAQAIAEHVGRAVETVDAFDELDVGEWTGLPFQTLSQDPRWHVWNTRRASARPPGGESMAELRDRVIGHLDALRNRAGASAIIVSHAEPIRAAVLHGRGMSLDRFDEIRIEPASVTVLQLESRHATVAPCHAVPS